MYQYHDEFESKSSLFETMNIINEHISFVPMSFQSIFYMVASLCYVKQEDWKKSLEMCMKAKAAAIDDLHAAYALYHLGKHHSYSCNLYEALDTLQAAKKIFDDHLYINHSLLVQIDIGYVYLKMGFYQKSKNIYKDCMALNKNYAIDVSVQNNLYSYYLYSCIDGKFYDDIIEFCEILSNENQMNTQNYLCLAITYYYKNDLENANKYIYMAWEGIYNKDVNFIDREMIYGYRLVIKGKTFEKYEKKFLKVYQYALKKMDLHLQIFILETLIEFAKKENETQKLIQFYSLLHDKYKERH